MVPTLKTELNFTTQQYSYIVGAFQLAYTIMQPVCGYVLDLIGTRAGLTIFAVLWAIASCCHGLATGWLSLAAFRGLLGMAEAAAIPGGIKAVGEWFPAKERSIAVGWFNAGTSLGAMLAPPLVIFVELSFGWQAAFIVTGALGFVFAALWWLVYRVPARQSWLSEDERAYILAGQEPDKRADTEQASPQFRKILGTKRFWGIAIPRFLAEPAWQTFSFWIPLYLATERGMDLKGIAMFAWLPFLAADLGGVLGGYLSPFFMNRFGFRLVNSRLAGMVLGALLMIGPGCVGLAPDAFTAILLFCLGGFAHQMISALVNCLSADVFNREEVATANGLSGMAAWIGGLGFSLLVGALAETIGYTPLFACLTVFDLIGATVAVTLLRDRDPFGAANLPHAAGKA